MKYIERIVLCELIILGFIIISLSITGFIEWKNPISYLYDISAIEYRAFIVISLILSCVLSLRGGDGYEYE